MKVFVAGATGAVGRPLISALVAAGHETVGMTTSERNISTLGELGAVGVIANALDAPAVEQALRKVRPNAVIEELTSLPKHDSPEAMQASANRDRTLRLEGGRNVQNAAKAAGARRYIVQSTGFFYAPGPGLAVETDPLALNASPAISANVRTYYGFFYGPNTWFTADGDIANQLHQRTYPLVGSAHGVWSWVHVDDAAKATVAALDCAPGVYNVVDDDPSEMSVWLPSFAQTVGAPAPPRVSEEDALKNAGADAVYYANRLRGASNTKARRELDFAPRRLEWLQLDLVSAGSRQGKNRQ